MEDPVGEGGDIGVGYDNWRKAIEPCGRYWNASSCREHSW